MTNVMTATPLEIVLLLVVLWGVVIVVRVIDGLLRPGTKIRLMAEGQDYESLQVGIFTPKAVPVDQLGVGEVGFLLVGR